MLREEYQARAVAAREGLVQWVLCRAEHQADTVQTMAQTCWGWAIIEYVSQVAATAITVAFGARRKECVVSFGLDRVWQDIKERRPSGAAVEFMLRRIERLIAATAVVNARRVILIQWR